MSRQAAGPHRPPVRRKKDPTPIIMAILAVMVLPALAFGVYKFVVKKEQLPDELAVAIAPLRPQPQQNVADTMPVPEERGIRPIPKSPATPPRDPKADAAAFDAAMAAFNSNNAFTNGTSKDFDPYASRPMPTNFGAAGRTMAGSHLGANTAVDKTMKKIKESVELGKTLVIWLVDRSPSCEARRREVATHILKGYPSLIPAAAKDAKPEDAPLMSVVCSFASDVQYVTPAPTSDLNDVQKAFGEIAGEGGTTENTFAAVEAVVNKFATYAAPPHQRYLSIVVITDEVGDDQAQRDRAIDVVRKNSIPVYVIGQAAPFGGNGAAESSPEGSKGLITGPESRQMEWIHMDFPGGMAMMGGGEQECGLGPYSLAHLCRESGGDFYPVGGSGSSIALPGQYVPKYLSEKDYQAQVAGNKALQALHIASALPQAKQISSPSTSFSVDENGLVQPPNSLDIAMRPVALVMPGVNELFDILKKGEADRAKLTEPRQQAAFDLAIGRAMAAKVRTEGYIILLAAMKSGRKTAKGGAGSWNLTPADGIEKNSVLESMSKKAREYLEGVIKNHPSTPWAAAAQQELQAPIGWAWQEF